MVLNCVLDAHILEGSHTPLSCFIHCLLRVNHTKYHSSHFWKDETAKAFGHEVEPVDFVFFRVDHLALNQDLGFKLARKPIDKYFIAHVRKQPEVSEHHLVHYHIQLHPQA